MPTFKKDDNSKIIARLTGMDWDEIGVIEFKGSVLFPGQISKIRKGGEFEAIPVFLRVPKAKDLREARVKAREKAAEYKLDKDLDKDLIEDLEIMCLLSKCIRNTTSPYEEFEPFIEELDKRFDRQSLLAVWDRIDLLAQDTDPRIENLTEPEMLVVAAEIATSGSISPLAVLDQSVQNTFIVTMAAHFVNCAESKYCAERSEPSTPE